MKKERIEKSLSQLIALKIGDYVIETPKVKFGWDQLYGARANIHAIIDWFVGFAVVWQWVYRIFWDTIYDICRRCGKSHIRKKNAYGLCNWDGYCTSI